MSERPQEPQLQSTGTCGWCGGTGWERKVPGSNSSAGECHACKGEGRWTLTRPVDPPLPIPCPACGEERPRHFPGCGFPAGQKDVREGLLATIDLDPETLPVTWAEWDCLDAEEKGATLEDYFRVVAALTCRESGPHTGGRRHVV